MDKTAMQKKIDKDVEKKLISMLEENPRDLIMWMLVQLGKMCIETNAASLDLKQCSTFDKQRYQVKAKINVKKVPIDTP